MSIGWPLQERQTLERGAAGGMCGGWQCGGSAYSPGSNGFVYTNPGLYNTPALIYPGEATP